MLLFRSVCGSGTFHTPSLVKWRDVGVGRHSKWRPPWLFLSPFFPEPSSRVGALYPSLTPFPLASRFWILLCLPLPGKEQLIISHSFQHGAAGVSLRDGEGERCAALRSIAAECSLCSRTHTPSSPTFIFAKAPLLCHCVIKLICHSVNLCRRRDSMECLCVWVCVYVFVFCERLGSVAPYLLVSNQTAVDWFVFPPCICDPCQTARETPLSLLRSREP